MFGFRIARVQARLSAQIAQLLRDHQRLSVMQWRVLFMLDALGKTTPAEIVRETGLDKGQLSRTIRDMTERGLLEAVPNTDDMRGQVIDFSERGRALFQKVRPLIYDRQDRLLSVMSEEERKTFIRVLDLLEDEMNRIDAEEN
ncbi:MarR family winged helix-turn-helix transcriptional regulator [Sulfitobacter sp. HNIBRBA3233]|uniref:MarR family winged helix-turn-helix transcriptional regulator n=1 Tax=Sulfitobacter marinivivus TaxID=3158558 RepID=UPI0032DFA4A1